MLALALTHLFKLAALLAAAQPRAAAATAAAAAAPPDAAAAASPGSCAASTTQLLAPMDSSVDPESTALECFAGALLDKLVAKPRCHGWAMVVEHSSAGLPKPGWIATQPGTLATLTPFPPPTHPPPPPPPPLTLSLTLTRRHV